MAIIRWDPFRDVVTLRERMNRMFEDVFSGRAEEGKELTTSTWAVRKAASWARVRNATRSVICDSCLTSRSTYVCA